MWSPSNHQPAAERKGESLAKHTNDLLLSLDSPSVLSLCLSLLDSLASEAKVAEKKKKKKKKKEGVSWRARPIH